MIKLIFFILINSFILSDSIEISTDVFKPYTNPYSENLGFLSEIVIESFNEVKIDTNITFLPWTRANILTKKGEFDGLLGAFITEERVKSFYFSDPIYKDIVIIYSLANSKIEIDEFTDLYNYSIGVVRGYSYSDKFDSDPNLTKEFSTDSIANLNLLLNNRIDLIVESKLVTSYLLENEFQNYNKKLNQVYILNSDWLYLLFPKKLKKSKSLAKKFNIGLEKIKVKQKYNEILKKNKIE